MTPAEPRCSTQQDWGPALITPFSAPHRAAPRLSPTQRPAMSLIAKLCTANLNPLHNCALCMYCYYFLLGTFTF